MLNNRTKINTIVESILTDNLVQAGDTLAEVFVSILRKKLMERKKMIAANISMLESAADYGGDEPHHTLFTKKNAMRTTQYRNALSSSPNTHVTIAHRITGDHYSIPRRKYDMYKKEYDIVEETETIDEAVARRKNRNVQKMGRRKKIRIRIRKGKVQRNKIVSAVKGFKISKGSVKRISAKEKLHRKMGARKAKIKRRSKLSSFRRKFKVALRKRRAMGLR